MIISNGNKDALMNALYEIEKDSKVKISMNRDWENPEKPLEFKANWSDSNQTETDMEKMLNDLKKAKRIIEILNELELVIDEEWEEVTNREELNRLATKWYEAMKIY